MTTIYEEVLLQFQNVFFFRNFKLYTRYSVLVKKFIKNFFNLNRVALQINSTNEASVIGTKVFYKFSRDLTFH